MIDRKVFYDNVRGSVFGGSISPEQFDGTETLLNMWVEHYPDLNPAGFAYILATAYHESARTMQAVRETLAGSDDDAIRILDRAYARGQLGGVRAPYWRRDSDGKTWLGRGIVQLTLKDNYRRMSGWLRKRVGLDVDLLADPAKALDSELSARIAFEGMIHGLFRNGHWLAKYINDSKADFVGARNVVNGRFRDDHTSIARLADAFLGALQAAMAEGGGDRPETAARGTTALDRDELRTLHASIENALNGLPEGAVKTGLAISLAWHGTALDTPSPSPSPAAGTHAFRRSGRPTSATAQKDLNMKDEKHALMSKTIHGALTALFGMALPAIAPLVGVDFTTDDGGQVIEALSQIVTATGILYAIYGRVVATRRISV